MSEVQVKQWNIVIDTSVLVSSLKSSRGASFRILSLIASGKFDFHLSVPLIFEYEASLKGTTLGAKWTLDEIDELLDIICLFGIKHDIWYLWRPLSRDPGDDFVAELAVTAGVDAIVTHNVKDFHGMKTFGIKVLRPKEFLVEIGEAR